MWSRVVAARSRVFALFSLALGLLPGQAFAQPSKDNTSPPIDVPTTPVPQGPMAPPPPGAPPKAAPKPAPAKPTPAPKGGEEAKTEEEKKDLKYNNEGVFKMSGSKGPGVVGGAGGAKKKTTGAAAAPAKGKAASTAIVANWPGFRMTEDGGSEVIIEFSKATTAPSEHKAAGSLTYVFKGAHVLKTNNKNPLITVHFNTPVASVRLVPKKGELHLIIDYRAGADAAAASGMRAGSEGGGQQFFVKFPSGTWLPKGEGSEAMPPPPTQKLKSKGKGDAGDKGETPAPKKPESGGSKTGPSP